MVFWVSHRSLGAQILVTRVGKLGKVGCFGYVSSFQATDRAGDIMPGPHQDRTTPGIVLSCAGKREQNANY